MCRVRGFFRGKERPIKIRWKNFPKANFQILVFLAEIGKGPGLAKLYHLWKNLVADRRFQLLETKLVNLNYDSKL